MIFGLTAFEVARIAIMGAWGMGATWLACDMKDKREEAKRDKEIEEQMESEMQEQEMQDQTLNEWETLFHKMGIIKFDKGDRVKELLAEDKKYYRRITLEVTAGVKLENIQKSLDSLRTKLKAPRLSVSGEGDKIYLKEIKSEVEREYFKLRRIKSHKIPVGINHEGDFEYWDTTKDNSLLVAGTTGAGKTRVMHSIICNILSNPNNEVILIDLKNCVEFKRYRGIKGVRCVEGDEQQAKKIISGLVIDKDTRMEKIGKLDCADYEEYIEKCPTTDMKRIFLIADEIADFSSTENQEINKNLFRKKGSDEYNVIQDLRQITGKGRAAAIHVLLGSQRMTQDNIDPSTKNNCTAIIGMKMQNKHNSNLIIERDGLEVLEQGEAIAKLGGKEVEMWSFWFDNKTRDNIIQELKGR